MALSKPRSNNLVRKLTHFCVPSIIYTITGVSLYLLALAYGANIPYVFTAIIFVCFVGAINVLCGSGYKELAWIFSITPIVTFILLALTNHIPLLYTSLYSYQGAAQGIVTSAINVGQAGLQGIGQPGVGMGQPGVGMGGMQTDPMQTTGMQTMGMPTMGMQTMGMPTMGMQTMGMQTMGMQTMGMPTMGMPTDEMGMSTMGMPTMGMPTDEMGMMTMPA